MNLFESLPAILPEELVDVLLTSGPVRIERIVSHGQASPPGFWYDQAEHEWVLVVQGGARLSLNGETIELRPGDHIYIPAHQKHRVEWTTPDAITIWLAVFFRNDVVA